MARVYVARTVAQSDRGADVAWCVVESDSWRSPSGRLYRVTIQGETRVREAWTLEDAMRIVRAAVGD